MKTAYTIETHEHGILLLSQNGFPMTILRDIAPMVKNAGHNPKKALMAPGVANALASAPCSIAVAWDAESLRAWEAEIEARPSMGGIQGWVHGLDTGTSSEAIVYNLTGGKYVRQLNDHPRDADDFGRCYRLLRLFPDFRKRIGDMAKVSPYWAKLVAHWDELEAMAKATGLENRTGPFDREAWKRLSERIEELAK